MKRRILMSLLVIGAVTALVGFTVANFSDTETSENNTVSTGSLNLLVGTTPGGIGACDFSEDPFGSKFFNVSDAAPGDEFEVTICVWNDGSIDGLLTANVSGLTDKEVGACTEPEEDAEGPLTCANGDAGELRTKVSVDIWVDGDCDNINDDTVLDLNIENGDLWFFSGNMVELVNAVFPTGDMNANSKWCYGVQGTVDAGAGNKIQTDEVTADLTFTLEQD